MSRARDFADLAGSADAGGLTGRNLIINGAMQVAARGTSATLTSGLVFCVDRFQHTANTSGAGTASQQSFTAGQTDVPNATYYLRHDQTTGASAAPSVRQYIEDVNTYQGKTVVLSYYAKVGSGTLTVTPQIQQNFGSGGSSSVAANPTPSTHTITTSWQKFTCTFSLPSVSGKTIGSGNHLRMLLQFPTSTTFTFDLAQVQLEVGETATPFEHEDYGTTLAKCQRFYERTGLLMVTNTGTQGIPTGYYAVSKRASPTLTLTLYAGSGGLVTPMTGNASLPLAGFYQNGSNSVATNSLVEADAEL